jgi:hypothetical protein
MTDPIHVHSDTSTTEGLRLFDGLLHFLANLIHLTEQEERDAGIYLDSQHDMIDENLNNKENLQ